MRDVQITQMEEYVVDMVPNERFAVTKDVWKEPEGRKEFVENMEQWQSNANVKAVQTMQRNEECVRDLEQRLSKHMFQQQQ